MHALLWYSVDGKASECIVNVCTYLHVVAVEPHALLDGGGGRDVGLVEAAQTATDLQPPDTRNTRERGREGKREREKEREKGRWYVSERIRKRRKRKGIHIACSILL